MELCARNKTISIINPTLKNKYINNSSYGFIGTTYVEGRIYEVIEVVNEDVNEEGCNKETPPDKMIFYSWIGFLFCPITL